MQQLIPPKAQSRCWALAGQIAFCAVPSFLLVRIGQFGAAGAVFWASVAAFFAWSLIRRDPHGFLALYLGLIPAFMYFKAFSYAGPAYTAVAALIFWAATTSREVPYLGRNTLLLAMSAFGILYWWASFLMSGDMAVNFRVLELCLAAIATFVVARRRYLLAVSFSGIGLCAIMIGIGLAPYGSRLGEVDDRGIGFQGNPITLGLACAIFLVMIVVDHGRWVFFFKSRILKVALVGGVVVCMLLSTSRGGWLVALTGILLVFVTRPGQRKMVAGLGVALIVAIAVLAVSGKADTMFDYFARTAGDRGIGKATTGRSDQWALLPQIFMESPIYGWGPGTGPDSLAHFGARRLAFHSLFLHITSELGLIGLVPLLALLWAMVKRGAKHLAKTGEVAPLAAACCYVMVGLSVQGLDLISGVFLGVGFVALEFSNYYIVRRVPNAIVRTAAVAAPGHPAPLPQLAARATRS